MENILDLNSNDINSNLALNESKDNNINNNNNDEPENDKTINSSVNDSLSFENSNIEYNNNEEKYLSEDDTYNPKFKKGTSSVINVAFQIANTIIGAGILSLPVVMRYLGLILGSFFIIFNAILTNYSVNLLLKSHQLSKKNKYSTISKKVLGKTGYMFVCLMIISNGFFMCSTYMRIFGSNLNNIIAGYVDKNNFLVTNWHNYFYVIIIFFGMSFIIFIDKFEKIEKMSILGQTGIFIYFIGLLLIYLYKYKNNLLQEITKDYFFPSGDKIKMLTSLPSVILAYTFQFNCFEAYATLKIRTHKNFKKSTLLAIIFVSSIFLLSGIFGYLMYGDNLNTTILEALLIDMQKNKDTHFFIKFLLIVINIGFLCCSTTGIPLLFFSCRNNLFSTIKYIKKNFFVNTAYLNTIKNNKNEKFETMGKNNFQNNNNNNDIINIKEKEKNLYDLSKKTQKVISIILYILIGLFTVLLPNLRFVR